jgi:hypothetical protein
MTGAERPALRVVGAVVRRRRLEEAHPEAVILPPAAGRWRAVVPPGLIPGDGTRTTLGAWDLEGLMNQLDEIYPGRWRGAGRQRRLASALMSSRSRLSRRGTKA